MVCILHGYLLEGSGSNLWTREVVRSLCRLGETVHLVCQENHPERYDFISEVFVYGRDGAVDNVLNREVPYEGRCIMHKPQLGDTLPVYVRDHYEEFSNVVPMVELSDDEIGEYLNLNIEAVKKVLKEFPIGALLANHAVLMSVVAQRAGGSASVPFALMPHGSAIEYAVKKDERFLRYAADAFAAAGRIFVIGGELRERVKNVLSGVPNLDAKMTGLNLGVDTGLFEPVPAGRRRESIDRLLESLADLPRGRTHDDKFPDADVEKKLQSVNWDADRIVLYVGRIIASKGVHSIIAALPEILDSHPDAKLLVVGHGPLRGELEAFLHALRNGERDAAMEKPLPEVSGYFEQLRERGGLEAYFEKAARSLRPDSAVFTGYLTHGELHRLFPCCDVAIYPSVVAEAGPLVFLEALASGCFPMGTYFAGMGASIDSAAAALPPEDAELMKLSKDESNTVSDIIRNVTGALRLGGKHKEALRAVAVERYDWKIVAAKLAAELSLL